MGVLLGISMIMSGLAGLYFASFKHFVTKAIPIIAYVNPANLITDALMPCIMIPISGLH